MSAREKAPVALADAMRECAQLAQNLADVHVNQPEKYCGSCNTVANEIARRLRALAAQVEGPRFTPEEREALEIAARVLESAFRGSMTIVDGEDVGDRSARVVRGMLAEEGELLTKKEEQNETP